MAFELAKAIVRVIFDKGELKKGLGEARREVETFSKSAKAFAHELGSELQSLVIGASLAATVIELGKAAIETAANMSELAQETGFTVEQLSRLQYVSGRGVEEFSTGIRTFNQRITEAIQHGGQAQATFQSVGISLADLKTKSPYEILMRVADAFAHTADGAGKVTVASDLFGSRTGVHLIPTLNKGSAAIKQFGDEADRMGATISTKTAEDMEHFRTSMTRLKDTVVGQVAPPLLSVLKAVAIGAEIAAYTIDRAILGTIVLANASLMGLFSGRLKRSIEDYKDGSKELEKLTRATIDQIKGVDQQLQGMGGGDGAGDKKPLNPIIEAIQQANRMLDIQNAQLREQIALAQHAGPLAAELAHSHERMATAEMIRQRIDPGRAREAASLREQLRLTTALQAAEQQRRSLAEHFANEEASMRGEILKITLRAEDSERQAIEDTFEVRKLQLHNRRIAEIQAAASTAQTDEELARAWFDISMKFDQLEVDNEQVKNAKLIELRRKFGSDYASIIDQLILKQKTWGESVISSIDQIQSAFETQLGDAFFNAFTGHIEGIKSAIRSLAEDILRTITHLMAQRLVQMFIEKFLSGYGTAAAGGTVTTTPSYGGTGALAAPSVGLMAGSLSVIGGRMAAPSAPSVGGGGRSTELTQHLTVTLASDFFAGMRPAMLPTQGELAVMINADLLTNGPIRRTLRSVV